jgi:hypothetical protein
MFAWIREQLIDAGVDGPPAGTTIEAPTQDGDVEVAEGEEWDDAGGGGEEDGRESAPLASGPDLIRAVLGSDPDAFAATEGVTPEEWLAWAVSAPPHEWRMAAEAAGMGGAPQPSAYDLPTSLRVAFMQADIDARVAGAQRRR